MQDLTSSVAGQVRPTGSGPRPALQFLAEIAAIRRYNKDEEICSAENPSLHVYCVMAGAARECVVRASGRRHIVDLLLPGDFFRVTATSESRFSVQAVVRETVVACYPRARVEALADMDSELARALRDEVGRIIRRLKAQVLVLERTTAFEKVGGYLLQLSGRLSRPRDDTVSLPVTRYELADHLGLSAETVSRAMSELKGCGFIELLGPRQVTIIDRDHIEL